MLSSSQLDKAVSQGIISKEQVEALRKLAIAEQNAFGGAELSADIDFSVSSEDEPFRLLKGFRDFFIAIGIVILAIGLSMLAENSFDLMFDNKADWRETVLSGWIATATVLVLVVIAMAISEWVTKIQRLPLSSLVLTLIFALWTGLLAGTAFFSLVLSLGIGQNNIGAVHTATTYVGIFGAILALILYYRRYRLPFVLLPLAGAAVLAAILIINGIFVLDNNSLAARITIGACGVAVFVVAMLFDVQDKFRTTRLSECAFWLHLLAAPLIVHSILFDSVEGTLSSVTILLVVAVLAVFALIIDRRAMLVSALIYLGYSLFTIIKDISFFGEFNNSASLVILGMLVLGLGLGWTPIRYFFVTNLVWKSLREKLPPVAA